MNRQGYIIKTRCHLQRRLGYSGNVTASWLLVAHNFEDFLESPVKAVSLRTARGNMLIFTLKM